MGDAPKDSQHLRRGAVHQGGVVDHEFAVDLFKRAPAGLGAGRVAARLARRHHRAEQEATVPGRPLERRERPFKRLDSPGRGLREAVHQVRRSRRPGAAHRVPKLRRPVTSADLDDLRDRAQLSAMAREGLHDPNAIGAREGALVAVPEPANEQRREPELKTCAVCPLVGIAEEPLRLAPYLGRETPAPAPNLGDILGCEPHTVAQGEERGKQAGGRDRDLRLALNAIALARSAPRRARAPRPASHDKPSVPRGPSSRATGRRAPSGASANSSSCRRSKRPSESATYASPPSTSTLQTIS